MLITLMPQRQLFPPSLHDALPILMRLRGAAGEGKRVRLPSIRRVRFAGAERRLQIARHRLLVALHERQQVRQAMDAVEVERSEEHTSELQSPCNLVCRLLLEKKNQ